MRQISKAFLYALAIFSLGLAWTSCELDPTENNPIEASFVNIKTPDWEQNIGNTYKTEGILSVANGLYFLVTDVADYTSDNIIPEDRNINIVLSPNLGQSFEPNDYVGKRVSITGNLSKSIVPSLVNTAEFLGGLSLATLEVNNLIDIEILDQSQLFPVPEIFDFCTVYPGYCVNPTPDENKFALLYSGGVNERAAYPRYFNDIDMMYKILRHHGYPHENIRVVYKDGLEVGPDMAPVHYAATETGLNAAIDYLKDRMHEQSKFFLMMNNHGGGRFLGTPSSISGGVLDANGDEYRTDRPDDNIDEQYYYYDDHSSRLTDDFMASKIDELSFYEMIAVIKPCYSGGMIWDLRGENRVIMTSGTEDEVTWSHTSGLFGEQTYHFFAAIMQSDPLSLAPVNSDYNGDGRVSMYEAQRYIVENDARPESPQFDDDGDGIPVDIGSPTGPGSWTFLD